MRNATIGRGGRRGRGAERVTTRVEVRGRLTRVTVEARGLRRLERERLEMAVRVLMIGFNLRA